MMPTWHCQDSLSNWGSWHLGGWRPRSGGVKRSLRSGQSVRSSSAKCTRLHNVVQYLFVINYVVGQLATNTDTRNDGTDNQMNRVDETEFGLDWSKLTGGGTICKHKKEYFYLSQGLMYLSNTRLTLPWNLGPNSIEGGNLTKSWTIVAEINRCVREPVKNVLAEFVR